MGKTNLLMLTAVLAGYSAQAGLEPFSDDFDYGPRNDDNIPGWYDQTGRSEYYNKSGDRNSPFDSGTGSIGFHWDEGTGQFIYVFLGSYGDEQSLQFKFSVGNYKGTPKNKTQPGEFMIGVYKNNQLIPADNVDVASYPGTQVVDLERIPFVLTGSGSTKGISGDLDLSGGSLVSGDRIYFRIQFANPNNHTFNLDSVHVTIQ